MCQAFAAPSNAVMSRLLTSTPAIFSPNSTFFLTDSQGNNEYC